jgi:LemA protein
MIIAIWVVIAVLVLVVLGLVGAYNSLVRKRIRTQEAWAQIDVQLKRRHDLIPNLVETVKGYAAHERQTLERVIQARNQAMASHGVQEQAQAENVLTAALRQLFALSEAYPNLKANENFARLQEELATTENRIAFSRQHYNASGAEYNTACESFPSNVVAGIFAFKKVEYFELQEPREREAPQVKF